MRKLFTIVSAAFFVSSLLLSPAACEVVSDRAMAETLARMLGDKFKPDSLEVTVDGSHAYAEARGFTLSGVRIAMLRLEAILNGSGPPEAGGDIKTLASLIGYSWGEITLRDEDINAYFSANETRGFADLAVGFTPDGFKAEGIFTTRLIFTLRIRLRATGNFVLRRDGVYIDNAGIYVEGMKQPEFLTDQVMERANPLIEWDDIPFKVVFREINMDWDTATMTGYPSKFEGGATARWGTKGNAD
jgi:hypothetical protein